MVSANPPLADKLACPPGRFRQPIRIPTADFPVTEVRQTAEVGLGAES